jgi:membrane protein YdbS with pleckstrin-like domain
LFLAYERESVSRCCIVEKIVEAGQEAVRNKEVTLFEGGKKNTKKPDRDKTTSDESKPKDVKQPPFDNTSAKLNKRTLAELEEPQNLRLLEEQSLQSIIQISFLFSLGKSLKIILFALCTLFIYVLLYGWEGFVVVASFSQHIQLLVVRGSIAAAFLSIIYWEIYRQSLQVWIDGFTLRVSRGVFFKKRAAVPVSSFLTVFIQQSPFEFATRLHSCHIYTINNPSKDILTIPGMTRRSAFALKDYLALQVNRMGKPSKDAVDLEQEMRSAVQRVIESPKAESEPLSSGKKGNRRRAKKSKDKKNTQSNS